MADEFNLRILDVRTVAHYLDRGLITREQHQAWLESLPDDSASSVGTDTRMVRVHARPVEFSDETST